MTDVILGLVSAKQKSLFYAVTLSAGWDSPLQGLAGAFLAVAPFAPSAAKLKDACLTLSVDGLKVAMDFGLEAAAGALGIFDVRLSIGCSVSSHINFADKLIWCVISV